MCARCARLQPVNTAMKDYARLLGMKEEEVLAAELPP